VEATNPSPNTAMASWRFDDEDTWQFLVEELVAIIAWWEMRDWSVLFNYKNIVFKIISPVVRFQSASWEVLLCFAWVFVPFCALDLFPEGWFVSVSRGEWRRIRRAGRPVFSWLFLVLLSPLLVDSSVPWWMLYFLALASRISSSGASLCL